MPVTSVSGARPIETPLLSPNALGALRDLPHRLPLPAPLERELSELLARTPPGAGEPELARAYLRAVEAALSHALAFLDSELTRCVEAKFALGDTNSLQRRTIGDPRQQSNQYVTELKNRLGVEKGKWAQRTKDQAQDVLDKLEEQMRSFQVHYETAPAEVTIVVDEGWKSGFFRWLDGVLDQWAGHHNYILHGKTAMAIEAPAQDLSKHLGAPLDARVSPPVPTSGRALAGELPPLRHREELPTIWEAFFESLKGGLNTVAMLAGMVIVPVVGSIESHYSQGSDSNQTLSRATVMAVCMLPIVGFAIWATFRQRAKAVEKIEEKAQQVLKKDFETFSKNRIERFRVELERHGSDYVSSVQGVLAGRMESAISTTFAERETQLVREMTRVQMEGDRLADRISVIKQSRGALSGQLAVEIGKKLQELAP